MKGRHDASWPLFGAQGLQQPLALHSHSRGDTSTGAAVAELCSRPYEDAAGRSATAVAAAAGE
jgi:hypothetical protein